MNECEDDGYRNVCCNENGTDAATYKCGTDGSAGEVGTCTNEDVIATAGRRYTCNCNAGTVLGNPYCTGE